MFKFLMAICVTLPLAAVASAQTASELADRYAHHEVYDVQPGVQLTATFASNGLVCEMQIEQAHFGKDGADLRNGIEKGTCQWSDRPTCPTIGAGRKEPSRQHDPRDGASS